MKTFPVALVLLAGMLALSAAGFAADEEGVNGITAVASKVSDDYVRATRPDGTFQPESYAFGKGGCWTGEIKDKTFDPLTFLDVAHVIAPALASQSYLPAKDPKATKLLIMLYWGTTAVPEPYSDSVGYQQFQAMEKRIATPKVNSSSKGFHSLSSGNSSMDSGQEAAWSAAAIMLMMENRQRDLVDFNNAKMLGYDAPGIIGTSRGNYARGTAFGVDRQDLVDEIEENRYFVVLMAYDFGLMLKAKKHKLLWETRFSISERRNAFDQALPVMAQNAARYFGRPTRGLERARVLDGTVVIKAPTFIEFIPDPTK
jgi:hypothetical protein